MSTVFILSGPSGVGKTTFLTKLFSRRQSDIVLLPRYTDRPIRQGEDQGFEHYFTSHSGLLQKVFANDFIHIEKWGDYYSAIESRAIEDILDSDHDGILLSSVFGASRLQATYGVAVKSLYLWTGNRQSLLNPLSFEEKSPEVVELRWRIRKKLVEEGFSEYETATLTDDAFLTKRMVDNYLDIAAVNGRLRAGEDIAVIPNFRDKIEDSLVTFEGIRKKAALHSRSTGSRRGSGCFVLMPFRESLKPVFEDHIGKVCQQLGLSVTRADQIFSAGLVMDDISESVRTARYVIADLTDSNPNVFYELGICHAIGKQVILISQTHDVPFDVRHIRIIRYEYTPRGMSQFEYTLAETLKTLQATP